MAWELFLLLLLHIPLRLLLVHHGPQLTSIANSAAAAEAGSGVTHGALSFIGPGRRGGARRLRSMRRCSCTSTVREGIPVHWYNLFSHRIIPSDSFWRGLLAYHELPD